MSTRSEIGQDGARTPRGQRRDLGEPFVVTNLAQIVRTLNPHYGADCPVAVAYRVGRQDQLLIHGTLADIRDKAKEAGINCTALVLVGHILGDNQGPESRLYSEDLHHLLRPAVPARPIGLTLK